MAKEGKEVGAWSSSRPCESGRRSGLRSALRVEEGSEIGERREESGQKSGQQPKESAQTVIPLNISRRAGRRLLVQPEMW